MRKFTLYQAARHSGISRYKLEQAIREGLLNVDTGKGNIKCFIKESDLNSFIDSHGDQYRKYHYTEKPVVNAELTDFVPRQLHEQLIQEKERTIKILERFHSPQSNAEFLNKIKVLENCLEKALDAISDTSVSDSIRDQINTTTTRI